MNLTLTEILPDIVFISEHWYSYKESRIFPYIELDIYTFADYYCRSKLKNGSSLRLIKDSSNHKHIVDIKEFKEEIT